jgi:hypothetical protein
MPNTFHKCLFFLQTKAVRKEFLKRNQWNIPGKDRKGSSKSKPYMNEQMGHQYPKSQSDGWNTN